MSGDGRSVWQERSQVSFKYFFYCKEEHMIRNLPYKVQTTTL